VALPDLYTNAQLEIASGGAARLLQMSKAPTAASQVYSDFLDAVRRAAEADVRSIIGVSYVLSDATLNAAPLISELALTVAVYWAYWKGTGGQAVPDEVKGAYDNARRALGELRDGPRMPGTETEATGAHGIGTVIIDDPTRILRRNMRGFC